jgi:transposase InsO family protein
MLTKLITEIFMIGRQLYGARRISQTLLKPGHRLSRTRVARLMQASGLVVKTKRPFKATTRSDHSQAIANPIYYEPI